MDMTRKLSAGSLLLAGSIAAAHAQDTDNDTSIDEVIVRSSPLRSSISEVVLGTSVIRREEIIRTLDGTIGETLAGQPGVSATFFGPGASRPIIRGLGADRIRILTNDISSFDVSTASQDHLVATEMGNAEQVAVIQQEWNGLFLNGCRGVVTLLGYGFHDLLVQAEISECGHVYCLFSWRAGGSVPSAASLAIGTARVKRDVGVSWCA